VSFYGINATLQSESEPQHQRHDGIPPSQVFLSVFPPPSLQVNTPRRRSSTTAVHNVTLTFILQDQPSDNTARYEYGITQHFIMSSHVYCLDMYKDEAAMNLRCTRLPLYSHTYNYISTMHFTTASATLGALLAFVPLATAGNVCLARSCTLGLPTGAGPACGMRLWGPGREPCGGDSAELRG